MGRMSDKRPATT